MTADEATIAAAAVAYVVAVEAECEAFDIAERACDASRNRQAPSCSPTAQAAAEFAAQRHLAQYAVAANLKTAAFVALRDVVAKVLS